MSNMVEQIIAQNEKKYNDFKGELENIFKSANDEYNSMLKDYKRQIDYIKNDNGYSNEGKARENKKINNIFAQKVSDKAKEYYDKLIAKTDTELNKREKEEAESYIDKNDENYYKKKILNEITKQHLNSNMLVQLTYVNSMLNSITSLEDADMLEYVYKYASVDKNYSDEIINMIYLKARNILNAPVKRKDNTINVKMPDGTVESLNANQDSLDTVHIVQNKSKVGKIIEDFERYNYDYLSDISKLKNSFLSGKNRGEYPRNFYMSNDPKRDFNTNIVNTWGEAKKSNDPWSR